MGTDGFPIADERFAVNLNPNSQQPTLLRKNMGPQVVVCFAWPTHIQPKSGHTKGSADHQRALVAPGVEIVDRHVAFWFVKGGEFRAIPNFERLYCKAWSDFCDICTQFPKKT